MKCFDKLRRTISDGSYHFASQSIENSGTSNEFGAILNKRTLTEHGSAHNHDNDSVFPIYIATNGQTRDGREKAKATKIL